MTKPNVYSADLSTLQPDPHNANRGTQRGRGLLQRSLAELGAGRSIVVDKNGTTAAGAKTLQALVEAGMTDAIVVETDGTRPVVVKRTDWDLSDKKGAARRYAYADNRVAQIDLEWDPEVLAADLADGVDLGSLGFSDAEIRGLTGDSGSKDGDNDVPEPPADPMTKRGDVWILGPHRVMCGDSTDRADADRLLNGETAAMLFADPPYGVSYASKNEYLNAVGRGNSIQVPIENDHMSATDTSALWAKCFGVAESAMRPGAAYYITGPQGGDLLLLLLIAIRDAGLQLKHMLIWAKNNHVLGRCDYHYKHEPIIYGWKAGGAHKWNGGSSQFSVWDIDKPMKSDLHPTMKPVELVQRAIENSTDRDDLVFDPFLGSGTTLIAADSRGRRCFGMEMSPAYCDVIVARWEKATGGVAHREDPKIEGAKAEGAA